MNNNSSLGASLIKGYIKIQRVIRPKYIQKSQMFLLTDPNFKPIFELILKNRYRSIIYGT